MCSTHKFLLPMCQALRIVTSVILVCLLLGACAVHDSGDTTTLGVNTAGTFVIFSEEKELSKRLRLPVEEKFATTDTIVRIAVLAPFTGRDAQYGQDIIDGIRVGLALTADDSASSHLKVQVIPIDTGSTAVDMKYAAERLAQYSNIREVIGPVGTEGTKVIYGAVFGRGIPVFAFGGYDASLKDKRNLYIMVDESNVAARAVFMWKVLQQWGRYSKQYGGSNHSIYAIFPNTGTGDTLARGCQNKEGVTVFRYNNDGGAYATQREVSDVIREIEKSAEKSGACAVIKGEVPWIAVILEASGWESRELYHKMLASQKLRECQKSFLMVTGDDVAVVSKDVSGNNDATIDYVASGIMSMTGEAMYVRGAKKANVDNMSQLAFFAYDAFRIALVDVIGVPN